jgi:hypothetical protein
VIKVPNEGYTSHFFAGRPQIGGRISKYKKRNIEKFHRNFFAVSKKKFGLKKNWLKKNLVKKNLEALTPLTFFKTQFFFRL